MGQFKDPLVIEMLIMARTAEEQSNKSSSSSSVQTRINCANHCSTYYNLFYLAVLRPFCDIIIKDISDWTWWAFAPNCKDTYRSINLPYRNNTIYEFVFIEVQHPPACIVLVFHQIKFNLLETSSLPPSRLFFLGRLVFPIRVHLTYIVTVEWSISWE